MTAMISVMNKRGPLVGGNVSMGINVLQDFFNQFIFEPPSIAHSQTQSHTYAQAEARLHTQVHTRTHILTIRGFVNRATDWIAGTTRARMSELGI